MKALFGSKKEEVKEPPKPKLDLSNKEQVREVEKEYTKQLTKEMREIDRQIIHNDFAEKKCQNELKKAIKDKQDKAILRIYAGQVAQCRKMKGRLLMNKAKIQGLTYSMQGMFANMRMTHVLAGTNDVIKQISGLMNVKEMNKTMQDIQKSMMQFGLINEMVEDAMGTLDEDGDTNADESELDKIIDSVAEPIKGTHIVQPGVHKENVKDAELEDMENIIKSM